MDLKKILKAAIGLVALIVVLDAIAFFTILFIPETPAAEFFSRHEPIFNMLKQRISSPDLNRNDEEYPVAEHTVRYRFVEGLHTVKVGAGIPVYATPSSKGKVISATKEEFSLEVLEEQGSWLKVKFPFGSGWINPDILYSKGSPPPQYARHNQNYSDVSENRKLNGNTALHPVILIFVTFSNVP